MDRFLCFYHERRPGHGPAARVRGRGDDTIHDWNYLLTKLGLLRGTTR